MENIIAKKQPEMFNWSAFIAWFRETGRSFIARWWIWIALVISPTYLTYYFGQSTLEERIRQTIQREQKYEKEFKGPSDTGIYYQAGYTLGVATGYALKGWRALIAVILLVFVLLQLQYKYIFQQLFEQDKIGRRVYIALVAIGWLLLVIAFATVVGPVGKQVGLHWTLANGFVLLNIGYSLVMSWRNASRRQVLLIQERTRAELNALKAQVNPHFLFNSLNNIYGTAILEDSPRTAESIQQLSGIVRYVMEESQLQMTPIQRELRFIDDFVELQRLRLPSLNNIDIQIRIEWDEKPAQIVPLLLNPLIENAFKYGISLQYPCFVHIDLEVLNGVLHLKTKNSILPRTDLEKGTGLGLDNVRQRLNLAYHERHALTVSEGENTFSVDVTIRL